MYIIIIRFFFVIVTPMCNVNTEKSHSFLYLISECIRMLNKPLMNCHCSAYTHLANFKVQTLTSINNTTTNLLKAYIYGVKNDNGNDDGI
jgi:hypothetical protein